MDVPNTPAQWINRLGLTARAYEPLWRGRSIAILTRGAYDTGRELETMLAWLGPRPGQRLLDAACSSGLYARTLAGAEPSATIVAVDHSAAFVREARRRAARADLHVDVRRADVHALPYDDATFDAVACGGSLNEFADPERAIAEFARVLRPGGRLWLMYVAHARSLAGRAVQALLRPGGVRFPRVDDVHAHARSAGLRHLRGELRRPVVLGLYEKPRADEPAIE